MLGLSRALLTFLIALVTSQFVGPAWADPATDRPFFVRWVDARINAYIRGVHFADPHTGWAVGGGGTILATRDGGIHWEPLNSGTSKISTVCILPTRTPAGRSGMAGQS